MLENYCWHSALIVYSGQERSISNHMSFGTVRIALVCQKKFFQHCRHDGQQWSVSSFVFALLHLHPAALSLSSGCRSVRDQFPLFTVFPVKPHHNLTEKDSYYIYTGWFTRRRPLIKYYKWRRILLMETKLGEYIPRYMWRWVGLQKRLGLFLFLLETQGDTVFCVGEIFSSQGWRGVQ